MASLGPADRPEGDKPSNTVAVPAHLRGGNSDRTLLLIGSLNSSAMATARVWSGAMRRYPAFFRVRTNLLILCPRALLEIYPPKFARRPPVPAHTLNNRPAA